LVTQGYHLFPTYRKFEAELTPLIRETKDLLLKVDKDYLEVAQKFGEDPTKVQMLEFLGTITEFTVTLSKAADENKRREAEAEAERKRAAAGPAKAPKTAGLVDNQMATQRGILDELEKRLAQGQNRPRAVPDVQKPKDEPKPSGPAWGAVQLKKVPPK
jgi:hypothetical protein